MSEEMEQYNNLTLREIDEIIAKERLDALTPQPIMTARRDGTYYTGLYFIDDTTEAPTVMHSARYYESQGKHLFIGDNFKVEPNYWLPTISLRKGN